MDDLISKREVLEKYGISYGALYRWKRMGLIPEDWFEKKSAATGQETFFNRRAITERIETILRLKDTLSLEEIAAQLESSQTKSSLLRVTWKYGSTEIPLCDLSSLSVIGLDGKSRDITELIRSQINSEEQKHGIT